MRPRRQRRLENPSLELKGVARVLVGHKLKP
jgi:hypothetical protein